MSKPLAILATSVATALMTYAKSIDVSDEASPKMPAVENTASTVTEQESVNTTTSNAGASTTTSPQPTGNGQLSAQAVVDAGGTLTGAELDVDGCRWDESINTKKPALTKKGVYKKGVGVAADVYATKREELKAEAAANTTAPTQTAAPLPGAGAAPLPGAGTGEPGVAPMPMPGSTMPAQDPNETWKQPILNEIARLTNEGGVDFDCVAEVLTEHKATDGTFATVPSSEYEALHKSIAAWNICLDLIAKTTLACLELNGNNQAVIVEHIYTNGQFGCTDATLVTKDDTWRLYEMLLGYLNQLETHFQRANTAKFTPNPFA